MATSEADGTLGRLASIAGVGVFDPDEIADLPGSARRYLLHALQPATPLAGHVLLRMHGHLRLKPGGSILSMQAEQVIALPHGFAWKATVDLWWSRIVGHDAYENGKGEMKWNDHAEFRVARAPRGPSPSARSLAPET